MVCGGAPRQRRATVHDDGAGRSTSSIEHGLFGPEERLELIGGELIVREPQGEFHAPGIELVDAAVREAFGPGWRIRVQLPVNLDDESRPEPDISVVQGGRPAKPSPRCPRGRC